MTSRLFQRWVSGFGCCCGLLLSLVTLAQLPGRGWQTGCNISGLNGPVLAVAVRSRQNLIAAGSFTDAGGHLTADGAAHWNGRRWQPRGAGPGRGTNGEVDWALALPRQNQRRQR